ncbi:MAG: hypothetical protein P8Y53_21820 [Pseudolabrys sp.]
MDVEGTAHGIDRAGEFGQHAVAGGLENAALMLGDFRIDNLAPAVLQRRQRALLVGAHQPTVADHVSRKNGRQPPYGAPLGHSAMKRVPR